MVLVKVGDDGGVRRRRGVAERRQLGVERLVLADVELGVGGAATVPADLDIHLVCDNYGTHKTPAVKAWLARHPRFHLHFTPTSTSWINQVERWFGFLTEQKINETPTRASAPSRTTSATGSPTGTPIRDRLSGPRPPKRSSTHSHDFVGEFPTQDTSPRRPADFSLHGRT